MDLVTVRPSNAMTISDGIAVSGTKIPKINNCACTLASPAPAETNGGRNNAKNNTVLGVKSSTQTPCQTMEENDRFSTAWTFRITLELLLAFSIIPAPSQMR